jgi:hypothetical protein
MFSLDHYNYSSKLFLQQSQAWNRLTRPWLGRDSTDSTDFDDFLLKKWPVTKIDKTCLGIDRFWSNSAESTRNRPILPTMIYWETESGTTINNIFDIFSNLQYNFILKGGNNYPFFPLKRKRFVKIKTEKKKRKRKRKIKIRIYKRCTETSFKWKRNKNKRETDGRLSSPYTGSDHAVQVVVSGQRSRRLGAGRRRSCCTGGCYISSFMVMLYRRFRC